MKRKTKLEANKQQKGKKKQNGIKSNATWNTRCVKSQNFSVASRGGAAVQSQIDHTAKQNSRVPPTEQTLSFSQETVLDRKKNKKRTTNGLRLNCRSSPFEALRVRGAEREFRLSSTTFNDTLVLNVIETLRGADGL